MVPDNLFSLTIKSTYQVAMAKPALRVHTGDRDSLSRALNE